MPNVESVAVALSVVVTIVFSGFGGEAIVNVYNETHSPLSAYARSIYKFSQCCSMYGGKRRLQNILDVSWRKKRGRRFGGSCFQRLLFPVIYRMYTTIIQSLLTTPNYQSTRSRVPTKGKNVYDFQTCSSCEVWPWHLRWTIFQPWYYNYTVCNPRLTSNRTLRRTFSGVE